MNATTHAIHDILKGVNAAHVAVNRRMFDLAMANLANVEDLCGAVRQHIAKERDEQKQREGRQ